MNLDLLVPDIGDFENVEIIEVLVKKGDKINKNDPVVTLESDKSSVEVPSNYEGTIENINVKIGDKVSKGDVLISVSGEQADVNDQKIKSSKDKLPTDTEKIIQQAEESLEKKKKKLLQVKLIKKKRQLSKFLKKVILIL